MTWLQTPTVFWLGGGIISLNCSMYMGLVMLGRQKYIQQNHLCLEVEMAVEKLKGHQSPDIDQIPAVFIKAGGRTIHFEIHKLITFIWNKEEFPEE